MKKLSLFIIVVLVVIGSMSLYTVNQRDKALLLWLGKIERDPTTKQPVIMEPGLHFKIPFMNRVVTLDTRLQTMEQPPNRIMTAESKQVIVDAYAKWKIIDLEKFYTSTRGGDYTLANSLLYRRISDALRNEFGRRNIVELVSSARTEIIRLINEEAKENTADLGVEIVDIRIKSIDLPPDVSEEVYARMRSNRERIARELRAIGEADAERIRARADAVEVRTIAEAERHSRELRATGEAEAATIYATAYNQDSEFYAFLRSLQAYRHSLSETRDTVLVLQPDSEFFKYFNEKKK